MDRTMDHLTELNFLEARINQLSAALVEASVRLVTLEQRGPLIAPNVCAWVDYTQSIEHDLNRCLQDLSVLLTAHHWEGPEIPQRKDEWPLWWNSVRGELAHETSGTR